MLCKGNWVILTAHAEVEKLLPLSSDISQDTVQITAASATTPATEASP